MSEALVCQAKALAFLVNQAEVKCAVGRPLGEPLTFVGVTRKRYGVLIADKALTKSEAEAIISLRSRSQGRIALKRLEQKLRAEE